MGRSGDLGPTGVRGEGGFGEAHLGEPGCAACGTAGAAGGRVRPWRGWTARPPNGALASLRRRRCRKPLPSFRAQTSQVRFPLGINILPETLDRSTPANGCQL